MKNYITYYAGIMLVMIGFTSCKKDVKNIFNMFDDVAVVYHNNGPYAVTDYKEVNSGDSVYLDYTITSAKKGMYMVCVYEAGAAIPFIKTPLQASERKSYSNIVKLKMNSKVGRTSYRIWALDSAGVYMGDGYKTITIDVKSNYNYWSNRNLYVPDTLGKSNKCYLAALTGETFSYTDGGANSAKIDMAYVYNGSHTIYALNASPLPFTPYDVSSWTKKVTLFAAPKTNQGSAFLNLRTGEQVVSSAKSAKPTLKSVTGLAAGSLFYFQTAEGKYGALYVNYVTQSSSVNGVFINVDIKTER